MSSILQQTNPNGANFNVAYIGPEFSYPHAEEFDNAYMKQLYDYAYALGASGNAWHKAPPSESARISKIGASDPR